MKTHILVALDRQLSPNSSYKASSNGANGCPLKHDPFEIANQLAEKGILIYTVGCEPSIKPYKDFFMAISHITGGQYVPLKGASLLTKVIIGGAIEEISLESLSSDVDKQVAHMYKIAEENGRILDMDVLVNKIQHKLEVDGAHALQLRRNAARLDSASEAARKYSRMKNISEVRSSFRPRPDNEDSKEKPSAAVSAKKDEYEIVTQSVDYTQTSRMVQKAIMKHKLNYKVVSPTSGVNCVVVGDKNVGKEDFLRNYATTIGQSDESVVNSRYTFPFPGEESDWKLSMLSISGEEGNKKRRQLCYWDANIYIICFSVVDRNSFINVEQQWVPDVTDFCTENAHAMIIILVGTDSNKRKKGYPCVSEQEGKKVAESIGLRDTSYIECSSNEEGAVAIVNEVCRVYKEKTKL